MTLKNSIIKISKKILNCLDSNHQHLDLQPNVQKNQDGKGFRNQSRESFLFRYLIRS